MVNIPTADVPVSAGAGRTQLEWYNALRRIADNVLPELIILDRRKTFWITLQPPSTTLGGNILQLLSVDTTAAVGLSIQLDGTPGSSDLRLGFVTYGFFDGTSRGTAAITSFTEGAFTAGVSHPSNIRLETTASASASRTERMRIGASGSPYFPGATTTASAANAFLNSGSTPANELLRSTSSAKYKRDIEPLEDQYADKILELTPIWYRSKAKADNPDWSWYGLAAEDVAKIDPRLVHWGYHEDDWEEKLTEDETGKHAEMVLKPDAELKPDGVAYDRLSVMLLSIIKRQEKRIAALEAKLENAL